MAHSMQSMILLSRIVYYILYVYIYIMKVIMYVHITYYVRNAYGFIDSLTVLDSRLRDYKNGNQDELSHGPDFGGEPPPFPALLQLSYIQVETHSRSFLFTQIIVTWIFLIIIIGGLGKCVLLGILTITFKCLLGSISQIVGWCSIRTPTAKT